MTKDAKITVVGVGGGGTNAVNRMIEAGLIGVEFCVMNSELQALDNSPAEKKLQLGPETTRGLGAGGNPDTGARAAEESRSEIGKMLEGSQLVFISAGMGGGTGTGAAPMVANIARQAKALTVAVVTKPFAFEGARRMRLALEGIEALRQQVDAIIVIPNERLLTNTEKRTTLLDAFRMADDILLQGVQGISDIITVTGLVNVDFCDVEAVMSNAGPALMGIGRSSGDHRAREAAELATRSPLMETPIEGAQRILINITSSPDFALQELMEATGVVAALADPDSLIIYGHVFDHDMEDEVKITVLAAGLPGRPGEPAQPQRAATNDTVMPQFNARPIQYAPQAAPAPAPAPVPAPQPQPVQPRPAPVPQQTQPAQPKADSDSDYEIPAFLQGKK
ncbi:MAG: cell division protein FtsZ [Armatimonadota bacterium]